MNANSTYELPDSIRTSRVIGAVLYLSLMVVLVTAICDRLLAFDGNAPEGFVPLLNGRDLTGWKGLVADPPKRAKMTPDQLAEAQKVADQRMRDHWAVHD